MQRVYEIVAQISDLPANVLIEGESGTGKELIARAIHQNSSRASGTVCRSQLRGDSGKSA